MSSRPLSSLALTVAVLAVAIGGCAPIAEEPPATPTAVRGTPRPAATAATTPLIPRSLGLRLVFDRVDGAEAARAHAAFAPLTTRLAECHPGGGVIRLRLVTSRAGSRFTVEPESTLDGRAQRCVLETLSVIEMEGFSGDASAAARPTGFSALLRIEW